MSLLKGIAGAIGWLASSLAGIGAILYASGYLASVAQAHLLGLTNVLAFSHDRYLEAGGDFFVVVGAELLQVMLVLVVALAAVAVPMLIVLWLCLAALRRWAPGRLAGAQTRLARLVAERHFELRVAGCILLFLALLRVAEDPASFAELFRVSDLLLIDPQTLSGEAGRMLMSGDARRLDAVFSRCLYLELAAGTLTIAVWHLAAGWRLQLLVVSPFAMTCLLYTIFLPMLFGILKHRIEFPTVTVTLPKDLAGAPASGALFLLNKSESDFVLYDATERKVLWLPKDALKGMVVTGVEPLLRRSATLAQH